MTIQLSVTVWTVICFCLLMFILHNLLFKPVLQVIDKRRERINRAAEKRAEHDKQKKDYESALIEKKAVAYEEQQKRIKAEIETIRSDSKKAIESAKEERLRDVDFYREKTDIERDEILRELSNHANELATSFADSLIKDKGIWKSNT